MECVVAMLCNVLDWSKKARKHARTQDMRVYKCTCGNERMTVLGAVLAQAHGGSLLQPWRHTWRCLREVARLTGLMWCVVCLMWCVSNRKVSKKLTYQG